MVVRAFQPSVNTWDSAIGSKYFHGNWCNLTRAWYTSFSGKNSYSTKFLDVVHSISLENPSGFNCYSCNQLAVDGSHSYLESSSCSPVHSNFITLNTPLSRTSLSPCLYYFNFCSGPLRSYDACANIRRVQSIIRRSVLVQFHQE